VLKIFFFFFFLDIESFDCVKWKEILPTQEESAKRKMPMKQLVTKLLLSHNSLLPSCRHSYTAECAQLRVDCG
jgi:hypothetical protein